MNFLPSPVLVRDENGLVSYLNPAFTKTFGWTSDDLKGTTADCYIPDHLKGELLKKINELPLKKSVLKFPTQRLTKTGQLLDVVMRVGVDRNKDLEPEDMIIVFRDVTMKNRVIRNRDAMHRINQALPEYPELGQLMEYVGNEIKELLRAEGANVALLDEDRQEFFFLGVAHDNPDNRERIRKIRFRSDELLSDQVIKTGKPIIMTSISDDLEFHRKRDEKIGHKVNNTMIVPLRTKDRIIGTITAVNKKQGDFDKTDLETLNTIAGTVALSIENAGIWEALRKANEELTGLNKAKDRMIDHLSHELKTPIAVLLTSLKILSKRLEVLPRETWYPAFERARRNLDRLIGIEGQVYDIVEKKEFLHTAVFSLIFDQCLDEIETLLAEEIGENQVIPTIRKKIEDIFSSTDPDLKEVYLHSFVRNRLEAMEPLFKHRNIDVRAGLRSSSPIKIPLDPLKKIVDGLIRNAVENTPDQGRMEILVHDKGSQVEFIVQDNGIGLSREAQKRIFEGFFSTKETLHYSSKRPFDFNAGGKGADLLRMKIFSERYKFKIRMTSQRCSNLPKDGDICPGSITDCRETFNARCDGKTTVTLLFPFASGPWNG